MPSPYSVVVNMTLVVGVEDASINSTYCMFKIKLIFLANINKNVLTEMKINK
jgi:hypothetical protein